MTLGYTNINMISGMKKYGDSFMLLYLWRLFISKMGNQAHLPDMIGSLLEKIYLWRLLMFHMHVD